MSLTKEQIEKMRPMDFSHGIATPLSDDLRELCDMALRSLTASSAIQQSPEHLTTVDLAREMVRESGMFITEPDFLKARNITLEATNVALQERLAAAPEPVAQEPMYDAIADAVQVIADSAQEAFRKAGIEPGEWDSDDIVNDVARGIANDIERLAAPLKASPEDMQSPDTERMDWLEKRQVMWRHSISAVRGWFSVEQQSVRSAIDAERSLDMNRCELKGKS